MKLINNRDGNPASRGESFLPYTPNSYSIMDGDEIVGTFTQMRDHSFPRANVTCWIGMGQKFQSLAQVREFVKTLG